MELDPEDQPPATVEKAVETLYGLLSEEDKTAIRKLNQVGSHHGLGRYIRNSWSLWGDSPIKRDAVAVYKIAHADDISGLIRDWVLAKVLDKPFDPMKVCERFHKHWAMYGTDSLTAGGWPPGQKGGR